MRNCVLARCMARFGFAIVVASGVSPLAAQKPEEPALIQHVARIESMRIEFAADLLMPVLESHRLPRRREVELIASLFNRSDEATIPYPLMPAATSSRESFRLAVFLSSSASQKVDGYTIKLRLLSRLRAREPSRAATLFSYVHDPRPPLTVTCDDRTVPTVGEFYSTARRLSGHFTDILARPLSSVQQAAALLQFLAQEASLSGGELSMGATSLASSLRRISTSDRVFTTAELRMNFGENIKKLVEKPELSSALGKALIESYREYLRRQTQGERCADVLDKGKDPVLITVIGRFNRLAAAYDASELEARDVQPKQFVSGQKPAADCRMPPPTISRWLANYRKRGASEDRERLQTALEELLKAEGGEDQELCDFVLKTGTLLSMASTLPSDQIGQQAMSAAVRLAAHSRIKKTYPALWIYVAKQLVNFLHHPEPLLAHATQTYIQQAADGDLGAYADSERLFGSKNEYIKDALTNSERLISEF